MKKLLFPLLLIVCACSNLDYDSGWMDADSDQMGDILRNKLTKSDMEYANKFEAANTYREYISGDELSKKWGVPPSLRQQTNELFRLRIKNGAKTIAHAKFFKMSGRWTVESFVIPKD